MAGHATHVVWPGRRVPTHLVTRGARRGLKLVPERHVRYERASVRVQPPLRPVASATIPHTNDDDSCNREQPNARKRGSDSDPRVQQRPPRRRLCKACWWQAPSPRDSWRWARCPARKTPHGPNSSSEDSHTILRTKAYENTLRFTATSKRQWSSRTDKPAKVEDTALWVYYDVFHDWKHCVKLYWHVNLCMPVRSWMLAMKQQYRTVSGALSHLHTYNAYTYHHRFVSQNYI